MYVYIHVHEKERNIYIYTMYVYTCLYSSLNVYTSSVYIMLYMHTILAGVALPGADLGGGREGDLQDLSRVLEQSGRRPLQGEPFLQLTLTHAAESAELPASQAALPHCALKGTCTYIYM